MSVQGELTISLASREGLLHSDIVSSRPMTVAQLFSGKTVEQTLQTVPLLFNICAKAQAVTAVRAIESAMGLAKDENVESHREALVCIESLREHSLQVLMQWPSYIGENIDNGTLAKCVQSLNLLMLTISEQKILNFGVNSMSALSAKIKSLWADCMANLSQIIFGLPVEQWLQDSLSSIENWAQQAQTPAACFIKWLSQQSWKYAGDSNIQVLPNINDAELVARLLAERENFTAKPDWYTRSYELSWFNYQQAHNVIKDMQKMNGQGIYTRMIARLCEIARLMHKLQSFFEDGTRIETPISTVAGLAHVDAARGRLSHYVQLEGDTVKRLFILAPTEWNFHPHGVAAKSLCHLNSLSDLRLQADLLINAIDPCVGYQLQISGEVIH